MSQHSFGTLIILALASMIMVAFWRQVLLVVLSLLIAVFCFGLFYLVELVHA